VTRKRYFIVVFLAAVLAAGFGAYYYLRGGVTRQVLKTPSAETAGAVHVYKNSDKSIADIKIFAFYAVPKNKVGQLEPHWKDQFQAVLDDAVKFHDLQFRGRSQLTYVIFPEPIVLENDDIFYDTTTTDGGNPHGLINISEEINRRILEKGGDLYREQFAKTGSSEYRVMGILYEGVGASGGLIYDSSLQSAEEIAGQLGVPESIVYVVNITNVEAFFLVNRDYLIQNQLKSYGSSIFYHEFAHAFGLPDAFDEENAPYVSDVMGTGRYKPIENTYIDKSFLTAMGTYQ
jgi:hypothetical protein